MHVRCDDCGVQWYVSIYSVPDQEEARRLGMICWMCESNAHTRQIFDEWGGTSHRHGASQWKATLE